ncbi:MAG: hypothetical protein A3H97_13280 [Acidobacteria bacterium RIFCSPLOWO2_02_FULL_65_29]|nr:MAG: hypothetical protein A3H97_13280 [Acidobacteria bacterium RIFCSPLOWO2_02_FULL_65_29]
MISRRFVAGDAHALDDIVRVPVNEPVVFRDVTIWDGRGGPVGLGPWHRRMLRLVDEVLQGDKADEHALRTAGGDPRRRPGRRRQ